MRPDDSSGRAPMESFQEHLRDICSDFELLHRTNQELTLELEAMQKRQASRDVSREGNGADHQLAVWQPRPRVCEPIVQKRTPEIGRSRENTEQSFDVDKHVPLSHTLLPVPDEPVGAVASEDFRKSASQSTLPCEGRAPETQRGMKRAMTRGSRGLTNHRYTTSTPYASAARIEAWKEQFKRLAQGADGALCAEDVQLLSEDAGYPASIEEVRQVTDVLNEQLESGGAEPGCMNMAAFLFLMEASAKLHPAVPVLQKAMHKEELDHLACEAKNKIEEREAERAEPTTSPAVGLAMEVIPAAFILLNALVIGLQADIDPEGMQWAIAEIIFTVFFCCEFGCKVKLFGCRYVLCGRDRLWNGFDLLCILIALFDMSITYTYKFFIEQDGADFGFLMLLKMLRLARLARIIRLLRFKIFNELKMMVEGVFSGVRVLLWAIVLLIFLIFFLGIVLRTLMTGFPEFSTLNASMFTLFRCFTDGCAAYDGTPLQERLRLSYGNLGLIFIVAYILIFLFVTIGIFNLIMAIFIDNVVTANIKKKQFVLGEQSSRMESKMKSLILSFMANEGTARLSSASITEVEGEGVPITREIFNLWLQDQEMLNMLEECEIETSTKFELFDVLDVDMGGELSFEELISGLMSLRGPMSKSDILAIRLKVQYVTTMLQNICEKLQIEG